MRIAWCAICGALAVDQNAGLQWQAPGLLAVLDRSHLEELAELLHVLRRCRDLPERETPTAEDRRDTALSEVVANLAALASGPLARDLEQLEAAIAELRARPPSPKA